MAMILKNIWLALAVMLAAATHVQAAVPSLDVGSCDFGEVYAHQAAECVFTIENKGRDSLRLKVSPWHRSDAVEPESATIGAGKRVSFKARVRPDIAVGNSSRAFRVEADQPLALSQRYAYANGFVTTVLDDVRPMLDFGDVDLNQAAVKKSISLHSRETADFRVTKIVDTPPFLSVNIGPDGRTLTVAYKPDAPWGIRLDDRVIVALNTPNQSLATIQVKANLSGAVVPEQNPLSFGVVRNNQDQDIYIVLKRRDGKSFRTGSLAIEGMSARLEAVACEPAIVNCQRIRVQTGKELGVGSVTGLVKIGLPEFDQQLWVQISGLALPPGAEAPKMASESTAAEPRSEEELRLASDPKARGANDIREVLRAKVKEMGPVPAGRGPLLKWSVANEDLVRGYVIYRADHEAGPFVRINKTTIPVGPIEQGYANAYQWRDVDAVAGHVYWYSIGMLKSDGSKESLTGPQRVLAKP